MARRPITILRFDGPRFADHGLDVDVLPEIITYQRLLQETAKAIWRREHPHRRRLPKQFEKSISLKFFQLDAGSTGVPLIREVSRPQLAFLEDELEQAASLLERTIHVAPHAQTMPPELPKSVIPLFGQLGTTLRAEERLFVRAGEGTAEPACYDHRVRKSILRWAAGPYLDAVDVTGEVRATDLDGQRFTLRLPDGRKLAARFAPDQEQVVLEALGKHSNIRLRVRGQGEFQADDGSLHQLELVESIDLIQIEAPPPPSKGGPVWQRLAAMGSAVPDDVWREVPRDLAANVHEYLYGRKDPH